jgi:hypothetical protein
MLFILNISDLKIFEILIMKLYNANIEYICQTKQLASCLDDYGLGRLITFILWFNCTLAPLF